MVTDANGSILVDTDKNWTKKAVAKANSSILREGTVVGAVVSDES